MSAIARPGHDAAPRKAYRPEITRPDTPSIKERASREFRQKAKEAEALAESHFYAANKAKDHGDKDGEAVQLDLYEIHDMLARGFEAAAAHVLTVNTAAKK